SAGGTTCATGSAVAAGSTTAARRGCVRLQERVEDHGGAVQEEGASGAGVAALATVAAETAVASLKAGEADAETAGADSARAAAAVPLEPAPSQRERAALHVDAAALPGVGSGAAGSTGRIGRVSEQEPFTRIPTATSAAAGAGVVVDENGILDQR